MGCGSCGTTGSCAPSGCKSNGTCSTSGCNKLNVYNWLSDTAMPDNYKPFDIVEIRFKGSRKEFFRNKNGLELYAGDPVVLDSDMGYDVGHVSISGELVRLQLKKRGLREDSENIKNIQRKATEKDLERYNEAKTREEKVLERARTIALMMKLEMKLSDIEIQGDNKKVIFFYTAEGRVDFRELIKRFADEFKLRIEMRQIGYREEASRLGGIGSCGRELCCSTWLTDYKLVNTSAARYQNLSINMLKLSGQCGKLKCCLNYELDTYMEALEEFPKAKTVRIETETGVAYMMKTDILKRLTWFAYEDKHAWICVGLDTINEYLEMNAKGQKSPELVGEIMEIKGGSDDLDIPIAATDLANEDITRLDHKNQQKKKNNKKKKPGQPQNFRDRDNGNKGPNAEGQTPRPNNRPNNPNNSNRPDNRPNNRNNNGPGNERPNNDRPNNGGGNRPNNNRPNNNRPNNPNNNRPNGERPQQERKEGDRPMKPYNNNRPPKSDTPKPKDNPGE
ncbi:MAG: stage 0 sporulation family protein [Chitinophagaceae bacterium]